MFAPDTASIRSKFPILSRRVAILPTKCRVCQASGQQALPRFCKDTAASNPALKAGRFPAMAETLRLYRSIAVMDKKAPLPSLRSQKPNWDRAAALARQWELQQLARKLDQLAQFTAA